ncbi:MAG: trypsin-like serine protease [Nannocystales bacterium]
MLVPLSTVALLALSPTWQGPEPVEPVPHIYDGTETNGCQFPTTLMMGGCTATLVSPHVVITAAHCMGDSDGPPDFRMGNTVNAPTQLLATDYCRRNPEYDPSFNNGVNGQDITYCVLEEPVYDIPFTPIIYGCETEIISTGRDAWIVGIGNNDFNGEDDVGFGIKRYRQTRVAGMPGESLSDGVYVGSFQDAACGGDSGGPAYIQFPDGSWHVFGVVSGGPPPCGGGADLYAVMSEWVPWIEEDSGLDITPCHDTDGTWNPTGLCQGFEMDPLDPDREWSNFCLGEVSPPSETCGAAFDSVPDDDAPIVSITNPMTESTLDDAPSQLQIDIEADDGDGYGVRAVRLSINGQEQAAELREPPFGFSAEFPAGVYELTAVAEDWGGNIGESETVRVAIGAELPPLPEASTGAADASTGDDTSDGEAGTAAESTGGTGDGESSGAPADDGDSGCGCRSEGSGGSSWLLLGLVGLLRRRRSDARV